jgi:Leucine-rich repeat (LRR) protein
LEKLSLKSNNLTKIKKYYFKHLKELKELDLSNNQLKIDAITFKYFKKSSKKKSTLPNLETLILIGNSNDFNVSNSAIAEFKENTKVEVVILKPTTTNTRN